MTFKFKDEIIFLSTLQRILNGSSEEDQQLLTLDSVNYLFNLNKFPLIDKTFFSYLQKNYYKNEKIDINIMKNVDNLITFVSDNIITYLKMFSKDGKTINVKDMYDYCNTIEKIDKNNFKTFMKEISKDLLITDIAKYLEKILQE